MILTPEKDLDHDSFPPTGKQPPVKYMGYPMHKTSAEIAIP